MIGSRTAVTVTVADEATVAASARAEQGGRYAPLDGLRGVAILLVLSVHSFRYSGTCRLGVILGRFAEAGWVGVTLFFVLSGFLITGILVDTRSSPRFFRDFFARRSLRIFPLYFGFLAFYSFAVPHIATLAKRWPQPNGRSALLYWVYLSNMQEWLTGGTATSGPLDALWSLSVEEQVYLVLPFVVALVPARRFGTALVMMVVVSFAWRLLTRFAGLSVALAYTWAPGNIEAFAAGGLVAYLQRTHPALLSRLARMALLLAGTFIGGMAVGMRHFNFWRAPAEVLTVGTSGVCWAFAGLIAVSLCMPSVSLLNRSLSTRALRTFGKYSYAIYVFHMPLAALLRPAICPHDEGQTSLSRAVLLFIAIVGTSYTAALISWYVWEIHFLRLKRFFPTSSDHSIA